MYEPHLIRQPAIQKKVLARAIKAAPFVVCSDLDIKKLNLIKKATGNSSGS
jgi:hypothetical protein